MANEPRFSLICLGAGCWKEPTKKLCCAACPEHTNCPDVCDTWKSNKYTCNSMQLVRIVNKEDKD